MGADLMRHYTKAEWRKIPEAYKGRWEPTPLNLERVKSGELPAEYIGKRNTIVNDEHPRPTSASKWDWQRNSPSTYRVITTRGNSEMNARLNIGLFSRNCVTGFANVSTEVSSVCTDITEK